jgi:diacylglycerol kinase family enzyme
LGEISRVEVIVNRAAGSVGPTAPANAEKILANFGFAAHVAAPAPEELMKCLRAAVDAAPDLLVILAGDGTARAAAEMCGPDGPMIAPLPGGTMNMLPHAVYGVRPWPEALTLALSGGEERMLGGGEVEGYRFLVAAILGPPALWAPAREAARSGKGWLAVLRARRAMARAFTGRLRYNLDSGPRQKADALVFMCPMGSKKLDDGDQVLEAAALDMHDLTGLVRMGFHAIVGDWRDDPLVVAERCQVARVWSAQSIPALLDGESVRLTSLAELRYQPRLVRVLSPPPKRAK